MDKAELLRLIDEDPDVRAKVLALLPPQPVAAERVALTADAPAPEPERAPAPEPAPEPVFHGPAWVKDKATGPHARGRFAK